MVTNLTEPYGGSLPQGVFDAAQDRQHSGLDVAQEAVVLGHEHVSHFLTNLVAGAVLVVKDVNHGLLDSQVARQLRWTLEILINRRIQNGR